MENKITVETLEVNKLQRLCDEETMIVQKQEDSINTRCFNENGSNGATGQRLVKFCILYIKDFVLINMTRIFCVMIKNS